MSNQQSKKSQQRLAIASALFLISILSSFLISYLSQSGAHYWVISHPIARGVEIESGDVLLVKAALGERTDGYLNSESSPVGSITRRNLKRGELINIGDLTDDVTWLTSESLSIAIRASDISPSISPGALVSLYQVHDARNGETVPEPVRILAGVFLEGIARTSANFGGDISLTLAVNREDVSTLLSATTSGRIVVVSSRG